MIELTYFSNKGKAESENMAYQVIQFRPGEAWQIVSEDEVIAKMDKVHGVWNLRSLGEIPEGMALGIAELIEAQAFNQLPIDIKSHWQEYVHEVVMKSDSQYLVICKDGVDFQHFERLFSECVGGLIKDPWEISFCVYNAQMSADFEFSAKGMELIADRKF